MKDIACCGLIPRIEITFLGKQHLGWWATAEGVNGLRADKEEFALAADASGRP